MNLLSNQYFNSESAKAGVVQYPKTRNMSNLLNPLALANSNIVVTRGPPSTETLTNGVSNSSSPSLPNETSEDSKTKESVFVICEICDGYIKDLSQLRTHMQLIHKVSFDSIYCHHNISDPIHLSNWPNIIR